RLVLFTTDRPPTRARQVIDGFSPVRRYARRWPGWHARSPRRAWRPATRPTPVADSGRATRPGRPAPGRSHSSMRERIGREGGVEDQRLGLAAEKLPAQPIIPIPIRGDLAAGAEPFRVPRERLGREEEFLARLRGVPEALTGHRQEEAPGDDMYAFRTTSR